MAAPIRDVLAEAVKLHQAGNLQQAESLYRQVLRADPRQADALNLLGVIANQTGKPEIGIDLIRQAIAIQPSEAEFHHNLAAAHKAVGEVAAAIAEHRLALRLKPDHVGAHVYLSDALMEQGDLAEALEHSREALRLQPDSALAYCTLGELAGFGQGAFTDADIERMQALVLSGRQSPHDASLLYFTLGAHWEKKQAHDEAFRCYAQANALKREVYHQKNKAFDPRQHRQLIDNLIAVFTPEFFERTRRFGSDSEIPLFVVGMVRSGTSLVEQILASHPLAFGVGELKDIDQIAGALPARLNVAASYPACLAHLDPASAKTMAYRYLQRLAHLTGEAIRVIDKMPHNYLHLGLIAVLFPRTRIIHCRRDPMDVCASAYFQNFKWLPYASSMEEIGFYHRQYERLMAHWRQVLPVPMQDVVYEEMVADQEAVSRKLVAFCGLDWDERCLQFHKSARVVQTASKLQVRQPIYTRSVARWQRFEAHLQPLKDALGGK